MEWLKSKTIMIAGGCLALIGLQGYGIMSMRNTMDERVSSVERELQSMHNQDNAKVTQLATDIDTITKRMGITTQELQQANELADGMGLRTIAYRAGMIGANVEINSKIDRGTTIRVAFPTAL